MWLQKRIILKARSRGFHLVTNEIIHQLPELSRFKIGLAHFFIQHTSASICINENADPSVRHDFESHFNANVPENTKYYTHTLEGSDDMPAHIKSSILGTSASIPISDGQLAFGTWQGIYLGEHRNHAGRRTILVTINGD